MSSPITKKGKKGAGCFGLTAFSANEAVPRVAALWLHFLFPLCDDAKDGLDFDFGRRFRLFTQIHL